MSLETAQESHGGGQSWELLWSEPASMCPNYLRPGSGVSTSYEPFLLGSTDVLPSLELMSLVLRM